MISSIHRVGALVLLASLPTGCHRCTGLAQPRPCAEQPDRLAGSVVFSRRDGDTLAIYRINADGTGERKLFENRDATNSNSMFPRWASDGSAIRFTAMRGGVWRRFSIGPAGQAPHPIAETPLLSSSRSRSAELVVERGELYVSRGATRTKVYAFSGYDSKIRVGASEAAWGPGRTHVIFQSCTGSTCGLHIARADGSGGCFLAAGRQPDWR